MKQLSTTIILFLFYASQAQIFPGNGTTIQIGGANGEKIIIRTGGSSQVDGPLEEEEDESEKGEEVIIIDEELEEVEESTHQNPGVLYRGVGFDWGENDKANFIRNNTMCSQPSMDEKDLRLLKYEVGDQRPANKLNFLKRELMQNCMTSEQIASLIKLFRNAQEQESLAQFAYMKTINTEDYAVALNAVNNTIVKNNLFQLLSVPRSEEADTFQTDNSEEEIIIEEVIIYQCDPLTNDEFSKMKARLDRISFTFDRRDAAKAAISNNCLTVDRLSELSSYLTSDSDKYPLLKSAYSNTADTENYWKLYDVFTFSSYQNDFLEYAKEKTNK